MCVSEEDSFLIPASRFQCLALVYDMDFKHENKLAGFRGAAHVLKSHVLKYFPVHEKQHSDSPQPDLMHLVVTR